MLHVERAMETRPKLITEMLPTELLTFPKSRRDDLVQQSAIAAIKSSVVDGDVTGASRLVKLFAALVKRKDSKQQLIDYLTTWGNLKLAEKDRFRYLRRFSREDWTEDYAAKVSSHRWNGPVHALDKNSTSEVRKLKVDAEVQIRKVLERLERINNDPRYDVKKMALTSKIRALLFEYGSDSLLQEQITRARVLFDESTARRTSRAGKYAKGS